MIRNKTADSLTYQVAEIVSRYNVRYELGDLDQKATHVTAFIVAVQDLYDKFGKGSREQFSRRFLGTSLCLDNLAEKMGLDLTRLFYF